MFNDESSADEAVDLLNNIIGRKIGNELRDDISFCGDLVEFTSIKDLAIATLNYYHNYGLWVVVKLSNGQYGIEQQKLSDEQYQMAYDRLITLDEYGYGPDNEEYYSYYGY